MYITMSYNINLEQNGKIFPLWIMANFKEYVLAATN